MARRAKTPATAPEPEVVEDQVRQIAAPDTAPEAAVEVIEDATLVAIAGRVEFSVGGRSVAFDWDRNLIGEVRKARTSPARLTVRDGVLVGVEV